MKPLICMFALHTFYLVINFCKTRNFYRISVACVACVQHCVACSLQETMYVWLVVCVKRHTKFLYFTDYGGKYSNAIFKLQYYSKFNKTEYVIQIYKSLFSIKNDRNMTIGSSTGTASISLHCFSVYKKEFLCITIYEEKC